MHNNIVIIDACGGNILSVKRAFAQYASNIQITHDPKVIATATHLVLPGVGAFGKCSQALQQHNLFEPIKNHIENNKPFLGICVGMQLLLSTGKEFGEHKGLNLIAGEVIAIPNSNKSSHKIPHIGWYPLEYNPPHRQEMLLANASNNNYAYFVHSFMAKPKDDKNIVAYYQFGELKIPAILKYKNAYGCQFHPEKSGEFGLVFLAQLIRNKQPSAKEKIYQ